MASITFDYETWDGETESVPQNEEPGTTGRVPHKEPFDEQTVALLLNSRVFGYSQQSGEYAEAVNNLVAALWITLAWFRRNGVSAEELERLVKRYPTLRHSWEQTVMDTVRSQMSPEVYSDPLSLRS